MRAIVTSLVAIFLSTSSFAEDNINVRDGQKIRVTGQVQIIERNGNQVPILNLIPRINVDNNELQYLYLKYGNEDQKAFINLLNEKINKKEMGISDYAVCSISKVGNENKSANCQITDIGKTNQLLMKKETEPSFFSKMQHKQMLNLVATNCNDEAVASGGGKKDYERCIKPYLDAYEYLFNLDKSNKANHFQWLLCAGDIGFNLGRYNYPMYKKCMKAIRVVCGDGVTFRSDNNTRNQCIRSMNTMQWIRRDL